MNAERSVKTTQANIVLMAAAPDPKHRDQLVLRPVERALPAQVLAQTH
jgi:hypothetical protein